MCEQSSTSRRSTTRLLETTAWVLPHEDQKTTTPHTLLKQRGRNTPPACALATACPPPGPEELEPPERAAVSDYARAAARIASNSGDALRPRAVGAASVRRATQNCCAAAPSSAPRARPEPPRRNAPRLRSSKGAPPLRARPLFLSLSRDVCGGCTISTYFEPRRHPGAQALEPARATAS